MRSGTQTHEHTCKHLCDPPKQMAEISVHQYVPNTMTQKSSYNFNQKYASIFLIMGRNITNYVAELHHRKSFKIINICMLISITRMA